MADSALLQALDYILNQSDETSIEVISEAVVRRKHSLTVFSALGDLVDPAKMAKEVSASLGGSTEKIIKGMKQSIKEMIVRILHEHAPELNDRQIEELCNSWLPGKENKENSASLPSDVLLSMVEQFVSFSQGSMSESADKSLREQMGAWPQRYWKAFPQVVRQIITDYLKNKITEKDYKSKILLAVGL